MQIVDTVFGTENMQSCTNDCSLYVPSSLLTLCLICWVVTLDKCKEMLC